MGGDDKGGQRWEMMVDRGDISGHKWWWSEIVMTVVRDEWLVLLAVVGHGGNGQR